MNVSSSLLSLKGLRKAMKNENIYCCGDSFWFTMNVICVKCSSKLFGLIVRFWWFYSIGDH